MLMEDYNEAVAGFRETEYPMLKGGGSTESLSRSRQN